MPPDKRNGRPGKDARPESARRQASQRPNYMRSGVDRTPETFGLTAVELYDHAVDLWLSGWDLEEILQVLALPREVLR